MQRRQLASTEVREVAGRVALPLLLDFMQSVRTGERVAATIGLRVQMIALGVVRSLISDRNRDVQATATAAWERMQNTAERAPSEVSGSADL